MAMELLLIGNPGRKRGRRPLSKSVHLRNPGAGRTASKIGGYKGMARRRSALSMGGLTQGAGVTDIVAAGGGLVVAGLVPSWVIKPAAGATLTSTQKWTKVGVALAATIAAGYIAKRVAPGAGKAAILGGLAGTLVQVINLAGGNIPLGGHPAPRQLGAPMMIRAPVPMPVTPFESEIITNVT